MFKTYGDLRKAISRSQMQACVAFVLKIGVAQLVRVVADDALHQRQVVEQDGTAQTPGYINPGRCQSVTNTRCWRERAAYMVMGE
jgi:hypothetical protein